MSSQPYPLLIQGISSDQNSANSTLKPAGALTNGGWTNKIQSGRGNLVLIDFIPTNQDYTSNTFKVLGIFSYQVGGQTVVQSAQVNGYLVSAFARSNEILMLDQPAGQSVKLSLDTQGGFTGLVVHHYFENKFSIPEVIQARHINTLKQRIQEFRHTFASGLKGGISALFNVPTGIGNIVGLEFILNCSTNNEIASQALFSMSVDGVQILDNAAGALFLNVSARPGLIFPIVIRSGSTFQLFADTSAVAVGDTFTFSVRAYLDNDTNGTKKYLPGC